MSKYPGYGNKNRFLTLRLGEELKYIHAKQGKKSLGFIEYIPEEYSWRVLHAPNYLVIHCLWVSETGLGLGTRLIDQCIEDAKRRNKEGVVVVTNNDTSWAPSKDIFVKKGFACVGKAPNSFELYAYKLGSGPDPYFPNNWAERLARFGQGLTVLVSGQCPYLHIAAENVVKVAKAAGMDPEMIELTTRDQLMELSPTPYGVYGVVFQGELISYHRLTSHSVLKRIKAVL
ncbi:GNAT family N-acetyltransferase [Paenibacillus sp. CAA11]|uniref:GNAT family N-acetyltransferase n=1 Tax=Paenibacillus sp. CAA11 TaxID=1532905 RepID=UPI002D798BA3|nr:GNAT family N-acetyltransferase [Paenibacillus sp. CAA11]